MMRKPLPTGTYNVPPAVTVGGAYGTPTHTFAVTLTPDRQSRCYTLTLTGPDAINHDLLINRDRRTVLGWYVRGRTVLTIREAAIAEAYRLIGHPLRGTGRTTPIA